ncbi:MAG: CmpA/NrtA family ABC transporter substrate-binding protein, partial [Planctomycetota bacterium]
IASEGLPLEPNGRNTAAGLARVLQRRLAQDRPPLRLGMVFPMSTHDLELRFWLSEAGIDPDRDVELVVVPPPRMVEALRAGDLAGFCVGEPWNSVAVAEGLGQVAITKHALWNHSPEKVLGVTKAWSEQNPHTHVALVSALIKAGQWLDTPEHRAEAAEILSLPQYVGIEPSRILPSLTGSFRVDASAEPIDAPWFHVFSDNQANMPWRSQALWYVTQMARWGQIESAYEAQLALSRVYRDDVYRGSAVTLGISVPRASEKTEGTHAEAWALPSDGNETIAMGPDLFFDQSVFDPAESYLVEAATTMETRAGGRTR